jgi:hypothetical protein
MQWGRSRSPPPRLPLGNGVQACSAAPARRRNRDGVIALSNGRGEGRTGGVKEERDMGGERDSPPVFSALRWGHRWASLPCCQSTGLPARCRRAQQHTNGAEASIQGPLDGADNHRLGSHITPAPCPPLPPSDATCPGCRPIQPPTPSLSAPHPRRCAAHHRGPLHSYRGPYRCCSVRCGCGGGQAPAGVSSRRHVVTAIVPIYIRAESHILLFPAAAIRFLEARERSVQSHKDACACLTKVTMENETNRPRRTCPC